jgi:hypothetical protein
MEQTRKNISTHRDGRVNVVLCGHGVTGKQVNNLVGGEPSVAKAPDDFVNGILYKMNPLILRSHFPDLPNGSGTKPGGDGREAFKRPARNSKRGAPGQLLTATAPAN